ncbi:hypothetical protein GCM10011488_55840 [Steroidobacter agaridevorans]|nr:hypothetical protein GCM10011488_55840 [Steroidobacter agaridevorans]
MHGHNKGLFSPITSGVREKNGELAAADADYHGVLAVKQSLAGFRRINGCLPARTRVVE